MNFGVKHPTVLPTHVKSAFCSVEITANYELSRELTFKQRLISEYWQDVATVTFTPVGRTIHILVNAHEKEHASLNKFAYS
ncbi:MAG: hypothetical protein H7339_09100 [Arcicella sp.]|nr:hypothetical protein [Arcicella sp.]